MTTQTKDSRTFVRPLLKAFVWLFIIVVVSVFTLLPHVLAPVAEKLILEKTASIHGLEHFNIDIETIGLSGIGIGKITTGESVSIDSVFCSYSPLSLIKKRLTSLTISGLEIKGVVDGSSPLLADFAPLPDSSKQSAPFSTSVDGTTTGNTGTHTDISTDTKIESIASILPLLPPDIEISHSFITLKNHDTIISIPFSLVCKIDHKNYNIKLLFTLLPMGQKISIALDADVRNLEIPNSRSRLQHLFRSIVLNAHNVAWSPMNELISIAAPEADIKLTGKSDITLVMGKDISKWQLNVSHIGIKIPLQAEINNIVFNLTLNNLKQLLEPDTMQNLPQKKGPSLYPSVLADGSFWFGSDMLSPVNVNYNFNMDSDKKWSFSAKGREMWEQKSFTIGADENSLKVRAPDFQLECSGKDGSTEGLFTLTMGRLLAEKQEFALDRLRFELPFKYGEAYKNRDKRGNRIITSKGLLNIEQLQYKGKKIASFKSDLLTVSGSDGKNTKSTNELVLNGKIDIDVASIPVKSKVRLIENNELIADFSYQLAPTTITPDLVKRIYMASDAKKASDTLSGTDFRLKLSSRGEFTFHDNRFESNLALDLDDGMLSVPEKKINISGIRTSLAFNDLPALRSLPGQVITVDKIEIKDLKISDAKMKYTIESNKIINSGKDKLQEELSFLVENASFKWCDGKVISESTRFSPSKSDYHISLFCDRLKLSSILQQVGAFDAEGEGTLNGRIPVSFSGGNLTFDNGFLYSTPGQGGKIKVLGTEKLTAGIPIDTPQFAQVDLAREALKNYRYEWAKLGFNTQDDQLTVKMEFDGKPENTLPFIYKKELGSFVRVKGKNAGSNFQGIKIDLNLQLPFNRMVRFGNEINNLFN